MKSVAYVALGIALPVVWFGCEWLRHFWFLWFITDQTYPVFFRLLYGASLIDWGFYLLVFLAVGAAIALSMQKNAPVLWAAGFGFAYSLMRAAISPIWVPPFHETFVTIWACGLYLMPPIGAVLGAFAARALLGRRASVGT